MKYLFIAACLISGCDSSALTYDELVNYPVECSKADQQLRHLRAVQNSKHFDPNPDNLSESDRAYNSRLKATIWWFAYKCNKS